MVCQKKSEATLYLPTPRGWTARFHFYPHFFTTHHDHAGVFVPAQPNPKEGGYDGVVVPKLWSLIKICVSWNGETGTGSLFLRTHFFITGRFGDILSGRQSLMLCLSPFFFAVLRWRSVFVPSSGFDMGKK